MIQSNTEDIFAHFQSNRDNYIILTTRSLDIDVNVIPKLLEIRPKYIGVIGSRKRWINTQEVLQARGITVDNIQTIFSPIGLDLKAETPQEIALSIMAEIMLIKNLATGEHLSLQWRKK